ncbi:MAG TPA: phosphatidylserine decarboxylase [Opitutae bacterium]|nr:phosphatidylserine decarboxylase [Opitutae bacterium]
MSIDAPIRYRDRQTGRIEAEQVYGEAWLKRIYGNPLGMLVLHAAVRRAWFSSLYGKFSDRPASAAKVGPFIKKFGIKMEDFVVPPGGYATFNDFFYRKLTAGARPVDADPSVAIFPADARHLGFQDISTAEGIYAKGQKLSVAELVGDRDLGERYARGTVICSRLCPVDYHRFHFPVAGTPSAAVPIDGTLGSVNPIALRRKLNWLWENKRTRVTLDAGAFGQVTLVAVGATNVGGIMETYTPGTMLTKGSERGYFRFGGSWVATLFEPGRVRLEQDLAGATAEGIELLARFGTPMARLA